MQYLVLATDYDGTLAQDGHVAATTLDALARVRQSGRKVVLVTGRELPELRDVFPEVALCDLVVAENGGVLYWPEDGREQAQADPLPPAFLAEMRRQNVEPCSVGRVIFATWRPHETVVLETIQRLGIGYQIIFNKRAVMVLPNGVDKASGLAAALRQLQIDPHCVVGVGDAENDLAFLARCGLSVAVENALQAVKERCDLVTRRDHGDGVCELVGQLLADDLQRLALHSSRTSRARAAD